MHNLHIGFAVTGNDRWPKDTAERLLKEAPNDLKQLGAAVTIIPEIVTNDLVAKKYSAMLKEKGIDVLVLMSGVFTLDMVPARFWDELHVPVILWAVPEQYGQGKRMWTNSLCASLMNSAALVRLGAKPKLVFARPATDRASEELSRYLRIIGCIKHLREQVIGIIGQRPPGFYSSTYEESMLRIKFGIEIKHFTLLDFVEKAKNLDPSFVEREIAFTKEQFPQTGDVPEKYYESHVHDYYTLKNWYDDEHVTAIGIKCWPELGAREMTPCGALARLATDGKLITCEADVHGMITLMIQKYLTNSPPFFADIIDINEADNALLLWHCGSASFDLAHSRDDICLCSHPLAGKGIVLEFPLKEGTVTVARLNQIDGKYRMLLFRGDAIKKEPYPRGSAVFVKLRKNVYEIIKTIAREGFPHHHCMIYGDVLDEMSEVCEYLDIEYFIL